MLASNGPTRPDASYAFEPKLDGWRAVVHVTGSGVGVYTRPGRQVAESVPALASLADVVPAGTVLDGELVAGSGRPWSFYQLGTLMATKPRGRRQDATFVAFDLLSVEGRPVMDQPYEHRRRLLEGLRLGGPAWCTVCQWCDESPSNLLEVCEQFEIEGLVGKRLGSRYKPGERSADWVKLKTTMWRALHGPQRFR
jgi:bifunctional non-homologous end joining protein LigD